MHSHSTSKTHKDVIEVGPVYSPMNGTIIKTKVMTATE